MGMIVIEIDGLPFSGQLLHAKVNGINRYEVAFTKAEVADFDVVFHPGQLGFSLDKVTGEILKVEDGQARIAGVQIGMVVTKIDGPPFSDELLREKFGGTERYGI